MLTKEEVERYLPKLQETEYSDFFGYIYSIARKTMDDQMRWWLDKFEKTASNNAGFYLVLLMMDEEVAPAAMNCGKVVGKRIGRVCTKLAEIFDDSKALEVYRTKDNLDSAKEIIQNNLSDLNIRLVHSFETYFSDCGDSIPELYFRIRLTEQENVKYPALGNDNSQEMYDRMQEIRTMIENMAGAPSSIDTELQNRKWAHLGLDNASLLRLQYANERLGYFPMFKAIELSVECFDKRDRDIINYCFNIFSGNHMFEMADVAKMSNVSRERVRQLRVKNMEKLEAVMMLIRSFDMLDGYHYDISSEYELGNIGSREEVPFNENFILWAMSKIYKDHVLIGDIERAFFKFPASDELLYLVPKALNDVFDFQRFLFTIEDKKLEKRFYDERLDLEIFIRNLNSKEIEDETFYKILSECRKMLERGYPDVITNSQLFFSQNSRKSIPDLIEDILRSHNSPMSAEEISDELNKLYPDLEQTPKKIGPNALRNPNITAISRTSTYTLTEWDMAEKRGGTIRNLAQEYLNSLIEPIAPLTDICDYIAKFRSDVKESSVKANLLAAAGNKFSIYYKESILHIGYTDYRFDDSYKIREKRQGRRSFQDSIAKLEQFIKVNERFPFSSGVDAEEARLNRFWAVSRQNFKKGILEPEEITEIERIEKSYGELRTRKERLSWEDRLERFVAYITEHETLPIKGSAEDNWYQESKELYFDGALDSDKTQAFTLVTKIVDRMMK